MQPDSGEERGASIPLHSFEITLRAARLSLVEDRAKQLHQPRQQLMIIGFEHSFGSSYGLALEDAASNQHRIAPSDW
jgi:hypothetical protein